MTTTMRSDHVRYLDDVPVPMRDGVRLSADIYLPNDGTEGPWPVLLARTPYDNNVLMENGFFWTQHGYVYVAQDVRGRWDSEGTFVPWEDETNDGWDTLEWIGQQPWCDGNVGMTGASYLAQVQWQVAPLQHPLLKTIVPRVMGSYLWDSPHYQGGAFGLGTNATWGWRTMARTTQRIDKFDWPKIFRTLPLRAIDRVSGKRHPSWSTWLDHNDYGDYWVPFAVDEHVAKYTIPVMQICGWYDIYAGAQPALYTLLREQAGSALARENQRLVMGPWTHVQAGGLFPAASTAAGDRDFGPDSRAVTAAMELAWMDRWLKGITRAEEADAAPVRVFVMGSNRWRDEQEWPLARTVWTPFYLRSGGSANTLWGDGALSTTAPGEEPADTYRYDPEEPTPTAGGCNCCTPEIVPWGAMDQRAVEARPDVLVYTTLPLAEDVEVIGPIVLHLWAATDGLDTDFTGKLVDVAPDGTAWNLCDGILRCRYRGGRGPARPMTPGVAEELRIDLWTTANVFKAGHRIRLEVSSSNFPRFDRNLNTGAPIGDDVSPRVAQQTVLHDAAHPSRLVLPVIPAT